MTDSKPAAEMSELVKMSPESGSPAAEKIDAAVAGDGSATAASDVAAVDVDNGSGGGDDGEPDGANAGGGDDKGDAGGDGVNDSGDGGVGGEGGGGDGEDGGVNAGDGAADGVDGAADEGDDGFDVGADADGGPSSMMGMGPPSPLTGCYLLIVLGEPHSTEHKDIILQRLLKGTSEIDGCGVVFSRYANCAAD